MPSLTLKVKLMNKIADIEEYAQTNPQVLAVNKVTGEVAAQFTLDEFAQTKNITGDRTQVANWILNHTMTGNIFVYRFKDMYDPHERWDIRTENHPILLYDIHNYRSVVAPSLSTACSYLNVSSATLNQALRGKIAINSRYVCIPLRYMGQFDGLSKQSMFYIAKHHLYVGEAS